MLKNYLRPYATVRVVFLSCSPQPLLVSACISTKEFLSDVWLSSSFLKTPGPTSCPDTSRSSLGREHSYCADLTLYFVTTPFGSTGAFHITRIYFAKAETLTCDGGPGSKRRNKKWQFNWLWKERTFSLGLTLIMIVKLVYLNPFNPNSDQSKIKKKNSDRPVVRSSHIASRVLPYDHLNRLNTCWDASGARDNPHDSVLKLINNSFCLRSNLKHSTQCFIPRWNTSRFVKNTPLRVVFSTLLAVFHLVIKHCVSCLIYYLKTWLYGKNYNSSKGEHAFLKVTNNVRFMFCTQRHASTLCWLLIETTENFTKKNPFLYSTIKNCQRGFIRVVKDFAGRRTS